MPKQTRTRTIQTARVVAFSGKGNGLHVSRLRPFVTNHFRVSGCVPYICGCAVRWPRGRRRRFAKRRSASRPSSFFLTNPHISSIPRSTDLPAVGSGSPVLGAGRDNFRDSPHQRSATRCDHLFPRCSCRGRRLVSATRSCCTSQRSDVAASLGERGI